MNTQKTCRSMSVLNEISTTSSRTPKTITHMLHGAGIFTNIDPINHPNVRKYSIHGASGYQCPEILIQISVLPPCHEMSHACSAIKRYSLWLFGEDETTWYIDLFLSETGGSGRFIPMVASFEAPVGC